MDEIHPFAAEAAWLASLSPRDRARFFACLSHNLTVDIRSLCFESDGTAETIELVRLLNEAHHRVSSYLSHYIWGDEDPGWLPAVVGCVLNQKNHAAQALARQSWGFATRTMEIKGRA